MAMRLKDLYINGDIINEIDTIFTLLQKNSVRFINADGDVQYFNEYHISQITIMDDKVYWMPSDYTYTEYLLVNLDSSDSVRDQIEDRFDLFVAIKRRIRI